MIIISELFICRLNSRSIRVRVSWGCSLCATYRGANQSSSTINVDPSSANRMGKVAALHTTENNKRQTTFVLLSGAPHERTVLLFEIRN